MDGKSKAASWFGNIYQKFETILQEADGDRGQAGVRYVGNQVQKVGKSVTELCSTVIQEILPPTTDPQKRIAQVVKDTESMKRGEKNHSNLTDKRFLSEFAAFDHSEDQTDHVQGDFRAASVLDEVAGSSKASTADNFDGRLEGNTENDSPPASSASEFWSAIEEAFGSSSSLNEQVDYDKTDSSSVCGTELESREDVNKCYESKSISDGSVVICTEKTEVVGLNLTNSSSTSDSFVSPALLEKYYPETSTTNRPLHSTLSHDDGTMEMRQADGKQLLDSVVIQDMLPPVIHLPKSETLDLPGTYFKPSQYWEESPTDSINNKYELQHAATDSSLIKLHCESNELHDSDSAASASMALYEDVTCHKDSGQTDHPFDIRNPDESVEEADEKEKSSGSDGAGSELQSSQDVDEVCDREWILNLSSSCNSSCRSSAVMPEKNIEDVRVDICRDLADSLAHLTSDLRKCLTETADNANTVCVRTSCSDLPSLPIGDQGDVDDDKCDDSNFESIALCDKTDLEDGPFSQVDKQLYEVAGRTRKLRSFKQRIQDAFTSKKRLSREYELLAIWFGDADINLKKDGFSDFFPPATTTSLELMKPKTSHSCDTDWELL